MTANPISEIGEPPLKLYKEFESIDDWIQKSKHRNKFELIPRFSASVNKLHEYIIRFSPQIIHFSGHGTNKGELIFEDEYGMGQIANLDVIETLFKIFRRRVRCIVLNACFSESQAELLSKHVDCVVGMSDEIYDRVAMEFATNFYYGISSEFSVKDAYELGKNQVKLLKIKDRQGKTIDVVEQSKMIKLISKQNIDPSTLSFL